MADYIDRDALYNVLEHRYKYLSGEGRRAFSLAIDDVLDAPTADVAEVRHGEWCICEEENTVDSYGRPVKYAKCSCCGFRWNDLYAVKNYFKACPNCSAIMDGVRSCDYYRG